MGREAIGVLVNDTQILAEREVIISAGAFQSPQLLMLSGIGPRADLALFNIPLLVDSPGVGQNMQDHIGMLGLGVTAEVNIPTAQTPSTAAAALALWNENRTGLLSDSNADAISFGKLNATALSTLSPATQQALSSLPEA